MKHLQEYYSQVTIKDGAAPDFSVLTEDEKARFENSLGFAFFRLNKSAQALAEAMKSLIPKRRRKVIRRTR